MRARLLVVLSLLAGLAIPLAHGHASSTPPRSTPEEDVVVVAVVDDSFSPYHYDFLGSRMPQHKNATRADDLPLRTSPAKWIPGFPKPSSFASYGALPITLATDPTENPATLSAKDSGVWNGMTASSRTQVNYRWIPGTKIVGAVDFSGNKVRNSGTAPNRSHGGGTSAVSTGNEHGTCPECVVVLVTFGGSDGEAATDWAMSQPWIDVVTHSYGYSTVAYDKIYKGSDLAKQRSAVERGQAVFWSASNGQVNAFDAPTTTYFSSAKGPDWLITVGASAPSGANYTGSGKTVDLASIGSAYPSMGGTTVSGEGTFSGTSNATPVVAGMYARALWWARTQLSGPSRAQRQGVIATGGGVRCGAARRACELGDGVLTRPELTKRLFEGAIRTPQGPTPVTDLGTPVTTPEYDFAAEGYGTYFARAKSTSQWQEEHARITGPLGGTTAALTRTGDERDWMVVDSFCRQEIWGSWTGGSYVAGRTALPGPSPLWPLRSALEATCPSLFPI
ncbi:MAG TPA: S8/S53 family peptidase [Mycobacteriales bacterium]|nr:S8/S53 family peptidase [Mycobacteriales bacterium]